MPTHQALNAYQIMWLFVFFDLPVDDPRHRHEATRFRHDLLEDGFVMLQFSVYIRHCASRENADVHIKRVRQFTPNGGKVSILCITDRQYGEIVNLWKVPVTPPKPAQQLELLL